MTPFKSFMILPGAGRETVNGARVIGWLWYVMSREG